MTDDWQALLTPDIKDFITTHQNDDIRALALKKPPYPNWPYPLILDQIKARQKAKSKIPAWYANDTIIFPPSDTLEQASSQATAKYKASLFHGQSFIDLTGGAAIDSWAMLDNFDHATIIDTDKNASTRIDHNLQILNDKTVTVINTSAEDFIETMESFDLALIDPQRRNQSRKGLYKLEDCSPNIIALMPHIKAKRILLKTSPMLDINLAIEQLGCVNAVHVIEWQGECKELLFTLTPSTPIQSVPITAVSLNDNGAPIHTIEFTRENEQNTAINYTQPLKYLYEPSPAFMKAGAYKSLAKHYNISKIHPHTHLYTSNTPIEHFPGRAFKIIETYPAQAKAIPFNKGNLTIRNFPQDTATLKKKLKLKDGGNDYLFACTTTEETNNKNLHILVHCKKINNIN
ncbi:MAG: SAM-dependent methyltransferase [Alphaproteobacteria bacterium]|nr:SAM-dependent methyltransferase [Alphaproteobacteria bacterium]